MTQKRSSFKNWLVDFLLRCFGRSYVVNAEGKSPKTHDFRRCPNCGIYVRFLDFEQAKILCRECGKMILSTESCWYSSGWYKDKKAYFHLKKPLHNPIISWWTVLTIVSILFLALTYRRVDIPSGFSNTLFDMLIWVLPFFNFLILSWFYIETKYSGFKKLITAISLIIFSVVAIFQIATKEKTVVPIWTNVPTEIEWQKQKKQEVQATLDNMDPGAEKFKVALNGEVNPQHYFIEAAKADFVGLMVDHHDYVINLNGESEKSFHKILYDFVREEIEEYSGEDNENFTLTCNHDQWNVVFTPTTFKKYPMIPKLCEGFVKD